MKKILTNLLVVVSLTSSLVAQDTKAVKVWFNQHKPIMQSSVPKFLSPQWMTEEKYFGSLSYPQKIRYIEMFWKIRSQEPINPGTSTAALINPEDSVAETPANLCANAKKIIEECKTRGEEVPDFILEQAKFVDPAGSPLEKEYQARLDYIATACVGEVYDIGLTFKPAWETRYGKAVLLQGPAEEVEAKDAFGLSDIHVGMYGNGYTVNYYAIWDDGSGGAFKYFLEKGSSGRVELGSPISVDRGKFYSCQRGYTAQWAPTEEGWKLWADSVKGEK